MLFLKGYRVNCSASVGMNVKVNWRAAFGLLLLTQLATSSAWAQSSCSSDGQAAPLAVLERFISADCATCWTSPATLKVKTSDLVVDWIVPSSRGDEAPLSAAARQDAQFRLQALNQTAPFDSWNLRRAVLAKPLPLRVARGVALGGYMGASIALIPQPGTRLPQHPMTAWLVMVEDIPAGTDGTPVARQLVRNTLQISWNEPDQSTTPNPTRPNQRLQESRPMSIPDGANPDRLRVVGWVEDPLGRVIATAASVCLK